MEGEAGTGANDTKNKEGVDVECGFVIMGSKRRSRCRWAKRAVSDSLS